MPSKFCQKLVNLFCNWRAVTAAIACFGATLSQVSAQPAGQAAAPEGPAGYTIVEDEVITQFKATATAQDQADAEAAAGITEKKHLHTPAMKAAGTQAEEDDDDPLKSPWVTEKIGG